jgi:ATP-binding cassette subfamily B protein RaxB
MTLESHAMRTPRKAMSNIVDRLALGLRKRLPLVLQTEAAECGLACLAMVAGFHGHRVDLATLRKRHSVSLKGATLAALIDVAAQAKLMARPVRLELEDLRHLRVPCVLHWSFNHFVVLRRATAAGAVIHDPAVGVRTVRMPELSRAFTGVALELWPSPQFARRRAAPAVRLRELLGRVTGLPGALAQLLSLAVALEVFALVSPLFMQWVIDHALVAGNRDLVTVLAIAFAALVVLEQSIGALRAWSIMRFSATLTAQWQVNVFRHLLRLPLGYFEKRHLGDVLSRFRSVDVIQRTFTGPFVEAFVDGLTAFVILAVMLRYSPPLTAVCVSATVLYALSRACTYRPLRRAVEEQIAHAAKQESHFLETVRGARAIKLYQREDERRSAWSSLLVEQINAGLRTQKLHVLHRVGNGLLLGIENVLVVAIGAGLVLDSRFSVGMLVAFVAYKRQFGARVSMLIDKLVDIAMLRLHGERLADIVLTAPEGSDGASRRAISPQPMPLIPDGDRAAHSPRSAALEIRGVRFRYAAHEPWVLDGLDLSIAAGESVAIVGASGCGKSTLVHVLLGMLEPEAGELSADGFDLARASVDTRRRTVGGVLQNDTLFAGSIADNIAFFDERPDQRRVEECARLAAIHDEIAAMPMGYDTLVGYMGTVLSGGQQQRVLLARALYKRPPILVLDEATSHLDVERERRVCAAIRSLDVTRIVVAHRPETIATVDRVVVLRDGRVVGDERLPSARTQDELLGSLARPALS